MARIFLVSTVVAASLVFTGCGSGGPDGAGDTPNESDMVAAAGPTTKLEFHCTTHPSSDDMDITLNHDTLEWDNGVKGKLDPTYRPTTNKNFVRYLGFATSEGAATMLVETTILKGQAGTAKLEWTGESFSMETFSCSKK